MFGGDSDEFDKWEKDNGWRVAIGVMGFLAGLMGTALLPSYAHELFSKKCQIGDCIFTDQNRIKRRFKKDKKTNLTPTLAPRNNGMTFGFTGTF